MMLTSGYPFAVLSEPDVIGGETMQSDVCPICFANGQRRCVAYVKAAAEGFVIINGRP
jgi:hypothetical protein